ncbi:PLP-dependent aminotransferase family protein [Yokenella regensburgei]|uniref:aminotransferase-like domain-containing protein n=1 Tax=Yokenella regensburgei TaxID=158877 RepID=UPI003F1437F3
MKARYKSIVDELADAISSGGLAPGTRLPTHRALAAERKISLVTATRVYAELESMGLVSGETGRGTFVREIMLPRGQGIDRDAIATDVIDLSFNYPALPEQTELLRSALRQLSVSGDLESLLRYQPHGGKLTERAVFAAYLAASGVNTEPENLLVVNGTQHGLTVVVMGLLKPGDVVAVDALTYPGFRVLAEQFHLELVAIPAKGEAMDLQALRQVCKTRRVKAVYTMPTLHNPLGWVVDEAFRREMALIAREHDLLIIEDATYVWLVENPPLPIHHYAPERTLYLAGFSKNVASGLRVGLLAVPEKRRQAVERAIRATTWNTPALMTALVCGWVQDGTVARLEGLKREDARFRQSVVREHLAPLRYQTHPTSYFIWLPLQEEVRADRVVSALLRENISLSTAEPFSASVHTPHAVRLAIGSVDIETLKKAVLTVRETIEYFNAQ